MTTRKSESISVYKNNVYSIGTIVYILLVPLRFPVLAVCGAIRGGESTLTIIDVTAIWPR